MSDEATKVEQLVTSIVHKDKLASDCRKEEQRLSSERNGYECVALNTVSKLAKELVASLGEAHAARLASELGMILGWDRVRGTAAPKGGA